MAEAGSKYHKWLKPLFFILAAIMLLVMALSSDQYGICWDDELQKNYGHDALKYYTSGGQDTTFINREKQIHLYGGLVEITSAVLEDYWDGDVYEMRHLYFSIYGFAAILVTGLLAAELGGWGIGILALLMLFFSPVFFGHSMFNSKDIPFATTYILSIYFIIRFIKNLPRPGFWNCMGVAISIALAINIRIGGLILLGIFFLFLGVAMAFHYWKEKGPLLPFIKTHLRLAGIALLIALVAYFGGLVFWPYGLMAPLANPFEALTAMSNYQFEIMFLFNGEWIVASQVPWYYIPKWIWISSPLFIALGLFTIPVFLVPHLAKKVNLNVLLFGMICFTWFFPIFYIIYKDSSLYDGWRHLLFVYPSLVVSCAIALGKLWQLIPKKEAQYSYVLLLVIIIGQPFVWMLKNHRYEQFYFSPLIGGTGGAFKKYEIDYYGTSIRYAVEWLAASADTLKTGPNGKTRVRVYYGELNSAKHFIDKYDKLQYVVAYENSPDWDYSIVQPSQAKHQRDLLENWPPPGMVHEIAIGGSPIIAITKNFNTSVNINTTSDINILINESVKLFNQGDFVKCIAACEKVLMLSPNNSIALNNIAIAMTSLKMYDEGIAYGEKAIVADPNSTLARNNFKEALAGKKNPEQLTPAQKANMYINLSLGPYYMGNYAKCIEYNQKALQLDPNLVMAYNNIGSSFNAIGQYKLALQALDKALELDPTSELVKNNRKVSLSGLNAQ